MSSTSELTLFLDRSLGGHLVAQALREAGATVQVHDDHFAQDAPDEVWLPEVTRRGWVAVSKDNSIRRGLLQRLMVARCGARLFVFTGGNMTGREMAARIAAAWPRLARLVVRYDAPFIATIQQSGNVVIWRDRQRLSEELHRAQSDPEETR